MQDQLNVKANEQWSEDTWIRACEFIRRDPRNKSTTADIRIQGLRYPLHPYQYYAVFVLLEWFVDGRNGGILADGMGLGKVSTSSLLH